VVGADLHKAYTFVHFRQWKTIERDVSLLAAVEDSERWTGEFLTRAEVVWLCRERRSKWIAVVMHLMAGEARHSRLIREF